MLIKHSCQMTVRDVMWQNAADWRQHRRDFWRRGHVWHFLRRWQSNFCWEPLVAPATSCPRAVGSISTPLWNMPVCHFHKVQLPKVLVKGWHFFILFFLISACCHNDSTHSVSSTKQSASGTNMRELACLPTSSNSGFSVSWVSYLESSVSDSSSSAGSGLVYNLCPANLLQGASLHALYYKYDWYWLKKTPQHYFLPIVMKVYVTFMFCINQDKRSVTNTVTHHKTLPVNICLHSSINWLHF